MWEMKSHKFWESLCRLLPLSNDFYFFWLTESHGQFYRGYYCEAVGKKAGIMYESKKYATYGRSLVTLASPRPSSTSPLPSGCPLSTTYDAIQFNRRPQKLKEIQFCRTATSHSVAAHDLSVRISLFLFPLCSHRPSSAYRPSHHSSSHPSSLSRYKYKHNTFVI